MGRLKRRGLKKSAGTLRGRAKKHYNEGIVLVSTNGSAAL
jgi:hypothetical protein